MGARWPVYVHRPHSIPLAALEEALGKGRPEIFNTDQGAQFTSEAFTGLLLEQGHPGQHGW